LLIDLILSFDSFNFDGFKKVFNFAYKTVDLFLFFDFVFKHDFFKTLINI
jgi:hypothetical protein